MARTACVRRIETLSKFGIRWRRQPPPLHRDRSCQASAGSGRTVAGIDGAAFNLSNFADGGEVLAIRDPRLSSALVHALLRH